MSTMQDTARQEELTGLFRALQKEQFAEKLLDSPYGSIDAIFALDDLGQLPIPKMVARVVKKTVDDTEELLLCLRSAQKSKYYGDLLAVGIRSLEDLIQKGDAGLPVPKMVARVLLKKATVFLQARELRIFLQSIQKAQYMEDLTRIGMTKPEHVRDSSPEALATVVPKMVSKIIYQHACQVCKPNEVDYERFSRFNEETRQQIIRLWKHLSGSHKSFGTEFYKTMLQLDSMAVKCFDRVNLETIGMDFDNMMDSLIQDLDPLTFTTRRDQLVSRLTRYCIPAQTLWLGVDAFETAAVLLQPELEVLYDLTSWRLLYFSIIPPLHPSILKTIGSSQGGVFNDSVFHEMTGNAFGAKLLDWFTRHGHVFVSHFLQEHPDFGQKLVQTIQTFQAWQKGSENWTACEEAMGNLLEGVQSKELKVLLLVETSRAIEDILSPVTAHALEGVLLTVGIALFGEESILSTYRSVQRDMVFDQWDEIYRFAAQECGDRIYELFTADPFGKAMFSRTNMTQQKKRFIHQLNVTLLRIHGGNSSDVKPILIEVGHIHRKFHHIESQALMMFSGPLKQSVSEMLGRTVWQRRSDDSWSFVLHALFDRYLRVGWACGGSLKSDILNWDLLRRFRDTNKQVFSTFCKNFSNSLQTAKLFPMGPGDASTRPCLSVAAIEGILDEPDALAAADRIQGLARRHRMFHGVTIEDINKCGKLWMSSAEATFAGKFDADLKLQWARFWDLFASSFGAHKDAVVSIEESLKEIVAAAETDDNKPPILTLQERIRCPGGMALLRFKSDKPVPQRAGQFVKIRIHIENRSVSRFYSVASAPDLNDTATELEFLIKEVEGGKMSPFLVHEIDPKCNVEVLTTAGSFALPEKVDGCQRIMISAGVGIVAFISAIRSMAKMHQANLIKKKVHLSLIHSERAFGLPVLEELVELSRTFDKDHEKFRFDLTLCFTGKELDTSVLETFRSKCPRLYTGRANAKILRSALSKFGEPSKTAMYACGPRVFQKMVRETFLKDFGHPRQLVHLEFFDL